LTKQVEITNRDGHILRGIVNIPEDGTRFPAIVNVHGFTGNKSGYKSIYTHTARLLAEHGFASVRFDLYGNGESDGGINIGTYIYPLLYSVMMAVLQVYFNMYINRVIVIAFIVAYNILAIYIPSWYVLGNMSMVYRSSNSVVKIECSVIVCCILIVIFTILTIFRFQKYDVISTEEK
jgi:hypothetical protein